MKRRNDIQGLRALAVTLVILCHLEFQNKAFRGGFIGVDVFFVISGYIITSLLIREYSHNANENSGYGWISLRAFYFRRVKRIIPAASLVIITTVASSSFLFNSVKSGWIRHDGFFASIFLANINLIQQKTDYFSQSLAQSPLEHYWSLSVEEQFYLIIPFLILVAVSFHGISVGKLKFWWERRVILLLAIITLISFVWSIIQTPNNPQSAYFSTLTRAWEIGVGAILALIAFQKESRISKKFANLIASFCLITILISSFVFDSNSRFPGYAAFIPVFATALLIDVGGRNSENFVSRLLAVRPLVYVGEISFSLYLWHLPIIVILGQNFQLVKNPALQSAILILITFTLTVATFYFVEKPCRNYPMPLSWESKPRMSKMGETKLSLFLSDVKVRRALIGILSFSLLLAGYKTAASIIYTRPAERSLPNLDFDNPSNLVDLLSQNSNDLSITSGDEAQANSSSKKILISISDENWSEKIKLGVQLKQAPATIVGNISSLTVDRTFTSPACKKLESADFQKTSEVTFCTSEITGAPLALFLGNSHGAMLFDAVGKSLNEIGYSVKGIFTSSCTISPKVIPLLNTTVVSKCKEFGEDLARYTKNKKPDLIVVSEAINVSFLNASGGSVMGPSAASFLIPNIEQSIRDFQATTPKIVLIDAFPNFPQISKCMSSSGILTSCVTSTEDTDIYRQINSTVASATGIPVISTLPWICNENNCPAIVDGTLVSPDGSHLTPQFAKVLQPKIKNSIDLALKSFETGNTPSPVSSSTLGDISNKNTANYADILASWQQEIKSGVGKLSTQNLNPSFAESAGKDVWANPDCGAKITITGTDLSNANSCLILGGSKNAVFIGNSHARMLQSTVSRSLKLRGYSTYSLARGACGIANVTPVVNRSPTKYCDDFRTAIQNLIDKVKPEIIVVSESDSTQSNNFLPPGINSMDGFSADTKLFWQEYQKALVTLKQKAKHLIVIGEKPHLPKNTTDCVDGSGKLSADCVGNPEEISQVVERSKNATSSVGGNFIDARDWFCTSKTCPAIISNILVYTDMSHLSYPIEAKLVPLFTSYISSLGL